MNRVFADSNYFLALLNSRDELHSRALAATSAISGNLVTTTWVLAEVLDALSQPVNRKLAVEFIHEMRSDPNVTVLAASQELFDDGFLLFSQRLDKDWSLTDCISFAAMGEANMTDVLSADRHFQQAGFTTLL